MHWSEIPAPTLSALRRGVVIPAHLLALDAQRRLDVRRQRALTRYYLDAGAGGLAVGVHATQFAIRDVGLYRPVLEQTMQTALQWQPIDGHRPLVMIAGLAGPTAQAQREAELARGLGYHAGLLSLAAMKGVGEDELIAHCEQVARVMPLVGFYLQPAVGGIVLPAQRLGKYKAFTQYCSVGFVLLPLTADADVFQHVVLYIAVALTVVSGLAIVRHGYVDWQRQDT